MDEHTRHLYRRETDAWREANDDARDCEESQPPDEPEDDGPTEAERVWWAAESAGAGPAAFRYTLIHRPALVGKPCPYGHIYGPWAIIDTWDDTVHSGWVDLDTAVQVMREIEARQTKGGA